MSICLNLSYDPLDIMVVIPHAPLPPPEILRIDAERVTNLHERIGALSD